MSRACWVWPRPCENEQVLARGLVEQFDGKPAFRNPIRFVKAETSSGDMPGLGEHTEEVLAAFGIARRHSGL